MTKKKGEATPPRNSRAHSSTPLKGPIGISVGKGTTLRNVQIIGFPTPVEVDNGSVRFINYFDDERGHIRDGEEIQRSDEHVSVRVKSDVDRGDSAEATLHQRYQKYAEEKKAITLLAAAYGFGVSGIHVEGEKYEDGVLRIGGDEVAVQVRFLDSALIGAVGKQRQLSRYELNRLQATIQNAIDAKADTRRVTAEAVADTVLALFSPIPFGQRIRARIEGATYDGKGFPEVWICPDGEKAFRIVHMKDAPRRKPRAPGRNGLPR